MARLWKLLLVAATAWPSSSSAEEVAYQAHDSRLLRRSLASGQAADVGPLPELFTRLAFSPTGVLYGVARRFPDTYLYTLDVRDATATEVTRLDFVERGIAGFAVDAAGILWLNEHAAPVVGAPNLLHRFDLRRGEVRTVEVELGIWSLAFRDGTLYSVHDFTLYAVDTVTGALDPQLTAGGFVLGTQGADFDSQGRLWLAKQGAIDPPFGDDHLDAVDVDTGGVLTRFVVPAGTFGVAIGDTEVICDSLCLRGGRVRVDAPWRDFENRTGVGRRVAASAPPAASDESGLLWFFEDDNWEVMVKVLDGCAFNGHYWFFAAGTTNLEVVLRVEDRVTGAVKEYFNPLGRAAAAITDVEAFATCP